MDAARLLEAGELWPSQGSDDSEPGVDDREGEGECDGVISSLAKSATVGMCGGEDGHPPSDGAGDVSEMCGVGALVAHCSRRPRGPSSYAGPSLIIDGGA